MTRAGTDPTAGLPRPLRVGVLVSGAGSNLQAILDRIGGGLPIQPAVVVSNRPDVRALGRAAAAGVPAVVIDHRAFPNRTAFEAELIRTLGAHEVGLVVLAGFMRLLTPAFLERFPLRVVNVHPALCPAFPGVEAPARALAWGVRYTGCTVHFVDSGADTGPIIAQAVVPVAPNDDPARLHARIQVEEHRLLPDALGWLAEGRVRVLDRRVWVER